MTINQLSVFVENKIGSLVDVTKTLYENEIDMRTLSVAETPDFGVLRAIVNDPEKTARLLTDAGYVCKLTPVLAVAIDDRPGGMYRVLQTLEQHSINLEYTYAFVTRTTDTAYMVLRVADNEKAIQVLQEQNIRLVSAQEVFKL
ncbi:MAG: acetolactate synthase [Lachnospiraceae bacterium]